MVSIGLIKTSFNFFLLKLKSQYLVNFLNKLTEHLDTLAEWCKICIWSAGAVSDENTKKIFVSPSACQTQKISRISSLAFLVSRFKAWGVHNFYPVKLK
jgi:hypothetical protein